MQKKQFLSPAEIAQELSVSSTTVLRMIHAGKIPAIRVSDRIYRIPRASFEMYKSGALKTPDLAPMGGVKPRPQLGRGESLPRARGLAGARVR